jgi:membrane protein DedA with SNARE-associated domain
MLDSLLHYLRTTHGPWPYALLLAAAALEYVFPPFPGDTVTLFGVFLAVTAGYSPPLVFAALIAGSTLGSVAAYGFGRTLPEDERHGPRWLRGPRAQRALAAIRARFAKHPRTFLALNRFVPALRGLVFVGAGIARVPLADVLLFGGIGAAAWNTILFAAGYLVGDHWDVLVTGVEHYSIAAVGAALVVVIAVWIVRRLRASRETGDG